MNLFSGNDVPTETGFVPVSSLTEPHPDLINSAHDGLFTSGTLSRYSPALRELEIHQSQQLAETAAD